MKRNPLCCAASLLLFVAAAPLEAAEPDPMVAARKLVAAMTPAQVEAAIAAIEEHHGELPPPLPPGAKATCDPKDRAGYSPLPGKPDCYPCGIPVQPNAEFLACYIARWEHPVELCCPGAHAELRYINHWMLKNMCKAGVLGTGWSCEPTTTEEVDAAWLIPKWNAKHCTYWYALFGSTGSTPTKRLGVLDRTRQPGAEWTRKHKIYGCTQYLVNTWTGEPEPDPPPVDPPPPPPACPPECEAEPCPAPPPCVQVCEPYALTARDQETLALLQSKLEALSKARLARVLVRLNALVSRLVAQCPTPSTGRTAVVVVPK